jgi:hypothetical protein
MFRHITHAKTNQSDGKSGCNEIPAPRGILEKRYLDFNNKHAEKNKEICPGTYLANKDSARSWILSFVAAM